MTDSLEKKLNDLAIHLAAVAKLSTTDIQDAVKIFKELREYQASLLTKDDPKGDKESGRRPTMQTMRERIKLVDSHGGDGDESA